jgi:hypothetical protein
MKAKLGGLLFALILLAFGGHMLASPAEYTDIDSSKMSGRNASIKKLLAEGVNILGPMPSAMILLGAGAFVGFVTLKSKSDKE